MKRRIITADEQDCYSVWRKYIVSFKRAGYASNIKRRTRRRERREGKREVRNEL